MGYYTSGYTDTAVISISEMKKNSLFLASVGTAHISQTIIKTKVTYGGVLGPQSEVKLAIALSARPFSSPTAQRKRSQMGLFYWCDGLISGP